MQIGATAEAIPVTGWPAAKPLRRQVELCPTKAAFYKLSHPRWGKTSREMMRPIRRKTSARDSRRTHSRRRGARNHGRTHRRLFRGNG